MKTLKKSANVILVTVFIMINVCYVHLTSFGYLASVSDCVVVTKFTMTKRNNVNVLTAMDFSEVFVRNVVVTFLSKMGIVSPALSTKLTIHTLNNASLLQNMKKLETNSKINANRMKYLTNY